MKKPYVVEIEESYHRTVVIYAENDTEAEELANQLCDDGEIDMERNCYAGRTCISAGEATVADMRGGYTVLQP